MVGGMELPISFGVFEAMALAGAFLYGTVVVWVIRSVYKDMCDDRQGEYETY